MNHTRLWISAVIITFVVVVGFMLSVPHTSDVVRTPTNTAATSVPQVTLHDVFKKGMHTITGSLSAPNACTVVTATAAAIGSASSTESIRVAISMTEDIGVCLQLPTSKSFSTTVAAPVHLQITATVNDSLATTTIQ